MIPLDGEILGDAMSDVGDLRVVAADHQTLLAHEVDETAALWVKLPSVAAAPTSVWLYYGGQASEAALPAAEVWSNGYVAVHHLSAALVDSTGGGHDGTATGATTTGGVVGDAFSFAGDGHAVDLAAAPDIDALFKMGGTVSVWIRPDGPGELGRGRILDRATTTGFGQGWALLMSDFATPGSVGFGYHASTEFGWWTTPMGSITDGTWQHVAASYTELDGEAQLYLGPEEMRPEEMGP